MDLQSGRLASSPLTRRDENLWSTCPEGMVINRPLWWFLLLLLPLVSLIVAILISSDVARAFGKETGFGLGLAFLGFIFYPILGFGDAQYQGPPSR